MPGLSRRRPYIDVYRENNSLSDLIWLGLIEEGPLVEGTPLWLDAYAVARETMQRARRNVKMIIEHLQRMGYRFAWDRNGVLDDRVPLIPPAPETAEQIEALARRAGAIPLALRAWWEIVGEVSLVGVFPDTWDENHRLPMNDALEVAPLSYAMWELDEWEQDEERREPFRALIAADIYHKANISGGPEYAIALPDGRADAPLENVTVLLPGPPSSGALPEDVRTNETFVSYLRRSFRWAGFPGYATPAHSVGRDASRQRDIERLKPLFELMISL